MTNEQTASLLIDAPLHQLRAIVLDPLALPDWNPAFIAIDGPPTATLGRDYAITVRPGLSGRLEYSEIGASRIGMTWRVRGLLEVATWTLDQGTGGTLVTHHFTHSGPLAAVLRRAFRGVAALRLDRLAAMK